MKTATFTEFRKKASTYFDIVEKGEKVRVFRHGKPVAELLPYAKNQLSIPSWKKPGIKLKIDGLSLSDEVIKNRRMAKS